MKFFFTILLIIPAMIANAQSPIKKVYAYSQVTMPGIRPTEGNNPLPEKYFLYVQVKKGTSLSSKNVVIDGNCYDVSVKKRKAPVYYQFYDGVIKHNKLLVPRTIDDVYELVLGEKHEAPDGKEKELSGTNQVVYNLMVNKKKVLFPVKATTKLPLIMGM